MYDAFISYSQRKDKPIAAALRAVIQTIGKPWYQRRSLRVFLDAASLAANPALWPSIETALTQSRYLIVLASREAAQSKWVDKEVQHWLATKGPSTLLIALTDGNLAWNEDRRQFEGGEDLPLPPSMRNAFVQEPLWVDLRAYREAAHRATKYNGEFLHKALDLAATIHGRPKEDLYSEELKQQKRNFALAYSGTAALAVISAVAVWKAIDATHQRDVAERNFEAARTAADGLVFDIARGLRNVDGMKVETVRKILGRAESSFTKLLHAAPGDTRLLNSAIIMKSEFVDTFVRVGAPREALEAALGGTAYAEDLLQAAGAVREAHAAQALSALKLGHAKLEGGDFDGANAAYMSSRDLRRRLVADQPSDVAMQRALTFSINALGELAERRGDGAEALRHFSEALEVREELVAQNPAWRRDLIVSYNKMSDAYLLLKQPAEARDVLNSAVNLARQLSKEAPDNTDAARNLAITLQRAGNVALDSDEAEMARIAFTESQAIFESLARRDQTDPELKRDVSIAIEKLGHAERALGDIPAARRSFARVTEARRALAASEPANALWATDLAEALMNLARSSPPAEAKPIFAEAIARLETLKASGFAGAEQDKWLATMRNEIGALR